MAIRDANILFFDGACGTNLQRMEILIVGTEYAGEIGFSHESSRELRL